jgi:hypothetical protein
MQPIAKLTPQEHAAFTLLEQEARCSFATDFDSLGCFNISKHEIRLQSRVPIYSHPYRKSLREREMLNLEIKKLKQKLFVRLVHHMLHQSFLYQRKMAPFACVSITDV